MYNINAVAALPFGFSAGYPARDLQTSHHSHRRQLSASGQSSHSSVHRSSDGSVFSSWQARTSVASTNSTWSGYSDFPPEQYIAQAEHMVDARSPVASPPPPEEPLPPVPAKRTHQRQTSQEGESFLTCISRPKRSRRSTREPRYWCTACGEGFGEKYDWKRHEETYQERTESFECDLCLNVYFLDKDFIHHHRGSHRCQVCVPKRHVELARKKRAVRTGWGCGFCVHFSTSWSERCNHISEHFEKDKRTMADWRHSRVIWSLLHRPEILKEWCRLLESKQRTQNPFAWKQSITGRSEGYPDTNTAPQLQDLLEFYTFPQNAAAIARLAFETGLRTKKSPSAPPPVPEKDYYPPQTSSRAPPLPNGSYPGVACDPIEISALDTFLGTIPEDTFLPTNVVTLDYDTLHAAFGSNFEHAGQY